MARTTHHRQRDHQGFDLDSNVVLDGATASFSDGDNLHDVISSLDGDTDSQKSGGFQFIIGGGASAITTGIKGDIEMPFAGAITAVRLFADQTGSIVVDLWKDTYTNFAPTGADSITASAKPTISSGIKSQDTTLTGWTTSFNAGDVIRVNVDSASTITRVTLALRIRRT